MSRCQLKITAILQDIARNLYDGQADAYAPDAASAVDVVRELAGQRLES